jgi:hypothetical protein
MKPKHRLLHVLLGILIILPAYFASFGVLSAGDVNAEIINLSYKTKTHVQAGCLSIQ